MGFRQDMVASGNDDGEGLDFGKVTFEDVPEDAGATEIAAVEPDKSAPEGIEKIPKEAAAEEVEGEAPATEETPKYEANFKYRGAEEDREVPDFLRGAITDAESERQIKTILAKADGLELVKTRADETRKERDQHRQSFDTIKSQVDDAAATYQRGDIDLFLNKLNIPEERMLQWALEKVQYNQLPPEQKALVDSKRTADRQLYETQKSNQAMSQQVQSREVEFLQNSMNYELQRPEVTTIQKAFDEALGKTGAFFAEVKKAGELHWIRSGGKQLLPANQAIKEVMDAYANVAKGKPAAAQQTAAVVPQATAIPAAKTKPSVIPNVAGKSATPLKSGPKSTDDLRKMAADFAKASS